MPPPPPAVQHRGQLQLSVVDPTDLTARLITLLRRELAARGIDTNAPSSPLVVRVVVLARQRRDESVQTHEVGTRQPVGFGLAGQEETVDYGKTYTQSDLRLSVSATLARAGSPAVTLASWDDDAGTLLRRDETRPAMSAWHSVYAAVAARLADQIAAALAEQR